MTERDVRKAIAAICDKLDRAARHRGPAALVPLVVGLQAIDWGCASDYGETSECDRVGWLRIAVGGHLQGASVSIDGPCLAPECTAPKPTQCGDCWARCNAEFGDSSEVTLHLQDGTSCSVERVFDHYSSCNVPEAAPVDFDCVSDSPCPTGGPLDGGT